MFEELIKEWDGETVITHYDRASGAWLFIAIHSTRLGPSVGGTRMKSYPKLQDALQDALRLSAGMTYKFAAPGIPFGGGKAVIATPPELDTQTRSALLQRYGKLLKQLGGLFSTGPDVGTSPMDMDIIAETGAPYVSARTLSAGGVGSPGPFTARGVLTGIEVICERLFGDASLRRRRILVQGTGDVGGNLINYLVEAGAEVTFSEVSATAISNFRDKLGLEFVTPDEIFSTDCEIFAPCALGGVLNARSIPLLNCKAVVGGANNQLACEGDAERLRARNILYAPDYVINVGGAMAVLGMEIQGWTREQAEKEVVECVRRTLLETLDIALKEGITTEIAARRIAERNLNVGKG